MLQLHMTTDGVRQEWAKYTKRVFIPSEIRFEITFVVPHIGPKSDIC